MRKKRKNLISVKARFAACFLLAVLVFASYAGTQVFASTMSGASVLESNMNASGTSSIYVNFKAGAADSASTLTLTLNGFTVNATQTISTATCVALFGGSANVLPTTGTLSASGSSPVVTVSSVGTLASGTDYCFQLTSASAVTNPTAGTYNNIVIADGTDTTTVGVDVISNDQISVSATVSPTFTLTFGGNSDSLGALSSTSVKASTGVTLTVLTNAANGWGLWAEDANTGLHSTAANKTIASVSTGANYNFATNTNAEHYGIGVTTSNATTNYADSGGSTGSGVTSSAYNEIATAGAPTAGATVTVKEIADISAITPAAVDYGDTLTIIGAGSF
jgi:hypothetical protein